MYIVDRVMDVPMSTRFGRFLSGAFRTLDERSGALADHVLLYLGLERSPCNLRLNSACYTSGLFGDDRCDCTWQLEYALGYFQRCRQGLLIYHMHHEGRGNGMIEKFRSFHAADRGNQYGALAYTSQGLPSDAREFESAVAVLRALGIEAVNLISNNLEKQRVLQAAGIKVVTRVPAIYAEPRLRRYYGWKRKDFHHHV